MSYNFSGSGNIIKIDAATVWCKGSKTISDSIFFEYSRFLWQLAGMLNPPTIKCLHAASSSHLSKITGMIVCQAHHIKTSVNQVLHITLRASEYVTHFWIATRFWRATFIQQNAL